MGLIQDITPRDPSAKPKQSPVKEMITKLHLPHKKLARKASKRDAELVDIIMRLRNRK